MTKHDIAAAVQQYIANGGTVTILPRGTKHRKPTLHRRWSGMPMARSLYGWQGG
jgi:hypothetical protein